MGLEVAAGQVAALNCQRQGDYSSHNRQHRQGNIHNRLIHNGQQRQSDSYGDMSGVDLLINHDVSRHEIEAYFIFSVFISGSVLK